MTWITKLNVYVSLLAIGGIIWLRVPTFQYDGGNERYSDSSHRNQRRDFSQLTVLSPISSMSTTTSSPEPHFELSATQTMEEWQVVTTAV